MELIRTTQTLCPHCTAEIEGNVVVEDGQVLLYRECPDHGPSALVLSKHGALYADLDRFYFQVLKNDKPSGRITNYWVLIKNTCQMNCAYCSVEMNDPFYEDMSLEQYRDMVKQYSRAKHTLTGGEPTLHPQLTEFVEEACRHGVTVQLATNGVMLADRACCERLKEAGVAEFRVSIDSFDAEQAARLGLDKFVEAKMKALDNLAALNLPTSLSPTIFKGINEDQLAACCEYAKDKPYIRSLSVNGFAWVTTIKGLGPENIIMPDEMMDLLYERYCTGPREDIYAFQKAIHALLHVMDIRLCMNVQIMLFVRTDNTLVPITEYLNMAGLKRALSRWERKARKGLFWQRLAFAGLAVRSLSWKTLRLLPAMIKLFMANLMGINIYEYPTVFLPVVLNTNCNVYNLDRTLGKQCMSGNLYMRQGSMCHGFSTETLTNKEKVHKRKTGGL